MLNGCYYVLIRRTDDGRFAGCIPDLPAATAAASTERELLEDLSAAARRCLRDMTLDGKPAPRPRAEEELPPREATKEYRRLLLILGSGRA